MHRFSNVGSADPHSVPTALIDFVKVVSKKTQNLCPFAKTSVTPRPQLQLFPVMQAHVRNAWRMPLFPFPFISIYQGIHH
jgi:hypothetical protein